MTSAQQPGSPHDAPNGVAKPLFVLQERYEVVNHLGQGGMGTVYVARDRRLGRRQCVVKKLRDDFFRQEDKEKAMSFFEREVLVLSQLQHSNIVHIHDSFKENDDCYLVMEYVEGENLHQMLHRRGEPFPEEQVLQWVMQIAEVLEYLHTNDPQIIYRDLKPSNIMIDTKDRVKLVDFGIARPYVEETDNTHVVSAGYSPPEQYWGAADPRSDIYALGATMYFLLTGEEPLALQTSMPRKVNSDVSEHTDHIVQRATAQDVLMRYQSALEMREDLDPRNQQGARAGATKTAFISIASLVTVLLIGAAISFFSSMAQQQKETEQEKRRVRLEAQQLRQKEAKLRRITEMQQGKLTEVVPSRDNNSQTDSPSGSSRSQKPKQATVAFREVDESELTDPDDQVTPQSQSPQPHTEEAAPPLAPSYKSTSTTTDETAPPEDTNSN